MISVIFHLCGLLYLIPRKDCTPVSKGTPYLSPVVNREIDFLSSTILNGRRAFYILIQLNLVNLHEKNKLKTLRSLSIVVIGGKSAAYFFANHTAVFPVMTLVIKVRSPL